MYGNYLTMDISYCMKDGKFTVAGDVNERGQVDLIETFIRGQMGRGEDRSAPVRKDVYHITLRWYPDTDEIVANYDTGNKSLREGILLDVLKQLTKKSR